MYLVLELEAIERTAPQLNATQPPERSLAHSKPGCVRAGSFSSCDGTSEPRRGGGLAGIGYGMDEWICTNGNLTMRPQGAVYSIERYYRDF